jgi:hypothetical protein
MGDIVLLPGVDEASVRDEPEFSLEEICEHQANLLERWRDFGAELKRRAERPLPLDLEIELSDLLLIDTDLSGTVIPIINTRKMSND